MHITYLNGSTLPKIHQECCAREPSLSCDVHTPLVVAYPAHRRSMDARSQRAHLTDQFGEGRGTPAQCWRRRHGVTARPFGGRSRITPQPWVVTVWGSVEGGRGVGFSSYFLRPLRSRHGEAPESFAFGRPAGRVRTTHNKNHSRDLSAFGMSEATPPAQRICIRLKRGAPDLCVPGHIWRHPQAFHAMW